MTKLKKSEPQQKENVKLGSCVGSGQYVKIHYQQYEPAASAQRPARYPCSICFGRPGGWMLFTNFIARLATWYTPLDLAVSSNKVTFWLRHNSHLFFLILSRGSFCKFYLLKCFPSSLVNPVMDLSILATRAHTSVPLCVSRSLLLYCKNQSVTFLGTPEPIVPSVMMSLVNSLNRFYCGGVSCAFTLKNWKLLVLCLCLCGASLCHSRHLEFRGQLSGGFCCLLCPEVLVIELRLSGLHGEGFRSWAILLAVDCSLTNSPCPQKSFSSIMRNANGISAFHLNRVPETHFHLRRAYYRWEQEVSNALVGQRPRSSSSQNVLAGNLRTVSDCCIFVS